MASPAGSGPSPSCRGTLDEVLVAHAGEGQRKVRIRVGDQLDLSLGQRPTDRGLPRRALGGDDHRRIVDPVAATLDLHLIERAGRRRERPYLIDASELTGEGKVVSR